MNNQNKNVLPQQNLTEFLKLWLCAAQIEVSIIKNRIIEVKVLKSYVMELR